MPQKEHHLIQNLSMLKVDTYTKTKAISYQHATMDVRFHSGPICVGSMVDRVAVGKVSSWYFVLSLSVSFYQGSIPI
jgi:hypothetical protein